MQNGSTLRVDGVSVSQDHVGRVPSESLDVAVRDLIGQHLSIDAEKVTDDAAFREDLGADSLDAFDLLLAFEETFGIEIPDNEADSMPRVGDAVAYINAHRVSR